MAQSELDVDADASPAPERGENDETQLIHAALTDPGAFEALYHRYRDHVHGYLRMRTASEEDAADLLQHVFVRVLDTLPRYQARRGTFAAWLFRIARNAAIDFHRRRRVTIAWDLVPLALHPSTEETAEARVLRQEDRARLAALIRALDPLKRDVLTLRFVGRLTVPEIAVVIGKREDATRKPLTRTLQTLKERYDEPSM